jgi:hypothetical protein
MPVEMALVSEHKLFWAEVGIDETFELFTILFISL